MIENDLLVSDFFTKRIENDINEQLFIRDYQMNFDEVLTYVDCLLEIPLGIFVEHVIGACSVGYITFQDVVQFSSFSDATLGVCKVLADNDNNGLTNIEVGNALLKDGKKRNDGALRKYGENHAKTAVELGLAHALYGRYYLTCLGMVFPFIEVPKREELLRRTILRNRFFQKLIKKAQVGPVSILKEMSFLSDSTAKRRLPNIRHLYSILNGNDSEVSDYFRNIQIVSFPE